MENQIKKFNIGYIYIVLTAILWSSGGFLIKIIDAHPLFIAFGRSFVVAIFFLPFIKFKQIRFCKELVVLCTGYILCLTTYVIATKLTTAANAIAIQYSAPLFLFIGMYVFKGVLDKKKILPMCLFSLALVAFLLEPSKGSNIYGNLIALLSGIGFALITYYFGFDYNISSIGLTGLLNLVMFPVVALFVPWSYEAITTDTRSIVALIALGILQIGLPYIFFNLGRKTVDAINASITCLIEPMLNPIWVFLIIGEVPSVYAFMGIFLIFIGQIANKLVSSKNENI